mgnify:FL=1
MGRYAAVGIMRHIGRMLVLRHIINIFLDKFFLSHH